MNIQDYKISSDCLDTINETFDDIIDITEEKTPFFMVFAVKNKDHNTEYMKFYMLPPELEMALSEDKLKKICEFHDVQYTNAVINNNDWSLTKAQKTKLKEKLNYLTYFCNQNKVPCFVAFALSNESSGDNPHTEYFMNIITPFNTGVTLYDDKITKILRYTLDPDIFPGKYFDASSDNNIMEVDSIYDDITKTSVIEDDGSITPLEPSLEGINGVEETPKNYNGLSNDFKDFPIDSVSELPKVDIPEVVEPVKKKKPVKKAAVQKPKIKTPSKAISLDKAFPDDFPC